MILVYIVLIEFAVLFEEWAWFEMESITSFILVNALAAWVILMLICASIYREAGMLARR